MLSFHCFGGLEEAGTGLAPALADGSLEPWYYYGGLFERIYASRPAALGPRVVSTPGLLVLPVRHDRVVFSGSRSAVLRPPGRSRNQNPDLSIKGTHQSIDATSVSKPSGTLGHVLEYGSQRLCDL
ncbi:hypothetical protein AAFF_G00098890 [Aldrovandia affinis]|uniref:Uncharacterized protein n=1 Tax=Aldrovandia affinis TaxID=143900 RepID=A0AAD7RV88_9TELE|nr:hypothetical protein AAFF_G00098890 [Aldrovandia affinis]